MDTMSERVKTDMRLPRMLIQHVEEVAELCGLPKNAFLTVAAAMLATQLSKRYAPGKKRKRMLLELEKMCEQVFVDARLT
jgi:hypothetical protein